MDQGDLGPSPASAPTHRRPAWSRGLACVACLPLLGFIGNGGRALWDEWRALRGDQASARANAVVGYLDINPNPSMAARPADWIREEGGETLLWAGYRESEHRWFRIARGEMDLRGLSEPIGRDAIRAVDRPIFERAGGERWGRVPEEAPVAGLEGGDEPPAYPLRVLDKVVVVNDRVGGRDVLVAFTPFEEGVSFFHAERQGRRVVMGQSGYFVGRRPLLFDRETDSLWVERDGAMAALAGPLKGASLARIARVVPVAWGEWRARHPGSRLLVGADRALRTAGAAAGPAASAP